MKIAVIAPPFICIPPEMYGGTELFIAHIAQGLKKRNIDVVVYTNGESTIDVPKRWLYEKAQWPIKGEIYDNLKDINHTSWSIADAVRDCDILHLNNLPGLAHSRLVRQPFVYTVHHPHVPGLSEFYKFFPEVEYVTISDFQRQHERMPRMRTIHHALDMQLYRLQKKKQPYFSFLGRIAPIKGTHVAIEIARRTGIPLKIAGEIQPLYREYWDSQIRPHVDGKLVEYVGEVGLEGKNELLGNSLAMLFPIDWDEPFGLVMIEAMACGTPVLAFPRGSVREIVKDGVSGYNCRDIDEMVMRAQSLAIAPETVHQHCQEHFSLECMVDRYIALYREMLSGRRNAGAAAATESPNQGSTSRVA